MPSQALRPEVEHEVVIVGAGFSGIGIGIKLKEAGVSDFVIVDAADGVGGVWHHNVYPGVAVDIPSTTYSYSFEPNPSWTRAFAPGPELKAYAEHCVEKYGLADHLDLNRRVDSAEFDEAEDVWRVRTDRGVITSRYLVSAVGLLDRPKRPEIEGIEDFEGPVLHTARWDSTVPLDGRVAVIGTGASGLQVIPEIAKCADSLDVYQRTPIWVVPQPNGDIPERVRRLHRRAPITQRIIRIFTDGVGELIMTAGVVNHSRLPFLARLMERVCLRHLDRQVDDPELRERLRPRYAFGCKRPSFSSAYWATFNEPHVELITDPIARITAAGIVTSAVDAETGEAVEALREIDALVLATGFKVMELGAVPAFPVHGVGGVELGRFWDENRFENYEGISTPLAPNFWLMNGPYSVAGSSWFSIIESGSRHIVRCITEARRRGAVRMTVKKQPHDRYTAGVREKQKHTALAQPSCALSNSYYFDRHGDTPFIRPVSGPQLWWASRTFNLDDYEYRRAEPAPRVQAGGATVLDEVG